MAGLATEWTKRLLYHWPRGYTEDGEMVAWCGRRLPLSRKGSSDDLPDNVCRSCQRCYGRAVRAGRGG